MEENNFSQEIENTGNQETPVSNEETNNPYAGRKPKHKRLVRWLWAMFIFGISSIIAVFLLLSMSNLPTFEELENPQSSLASEVYAGDNSLLGRYYIENRVPVHYNELSPHLITALIATEDERYYKHSGIDRKALMRVLVRTVLGGDSSGGGGSTISQQLAKLLFKRPDTAGKNKIKRALIMVSVKLKEWITAVKLERSYTKEEIITMYLNQFNFINGAYGVKSASEIYFNTRPQDLTIEEAAMLVGMLKNPALYNPKRFPEEAKTRREVVLKQMKRKKDITQEEYDSLRVLPLDMTKFRRTDHNSGLAPYFREYLRKDVKRILKDNKKPDGSAYDIHKDGIKVYTTIDPIMQKHAEDAAWEHLTKHQKKLFSHWEKLDPWTYKSDGVDDQEIELRTRALRKMVRESDRYDALRLKHLPIAYDLELRDADIDRLLIVEEEGDKKIKAWLKTGYINQGLADKYREIMRKDWKLVKEEWEGFQTTVEKNFDEKIEMTVFAYNENHQTDTTMSPLDSIRYMRMHLQVGMMAVDPATGFVKAWVGGIDHNYFKYDHVNKEMSRQVGSTFKPFLYALTIQNRGYSPCYPVMDVPITLEKGTFGLNQDWTPQNSGENYTGKMFTLKEALKYSKNTVSAYLMKDFQSVEPLRSYVASVGIDTNKTNPNDAFSYRVPPVPSICLGTPEISVFEMTGAYIPFANKGVYNQPVFVTRIEDRHGNPIYESVPSPKRVLAEKTFFVMIDMLRHVAIGTPDFYGLKTDIAGKTGTTNYHSDGWFMGVTPELVVGTWVGCDDRFIRFRTIHNGQGGVMARPIFSKFIRKLENDKTVAYNPSIRFDTPGADFNIELDCEKYIQATNIGTPWEVIQHSKPTDEEIEGQAPNDEGQGDYGSEFGDL